ncbi:helix-turn-helix domain-containing protein [Nocardia thraciensis]
MSGDAQVGAMLRDLREARSLPRAAVARTIDCDVSLLAHVEAGRRRITPWLARSLDDYYGTPGVVAALTRSRPTGPSPVASGDMLIVELPHGGTPMPLSRRDVLISLGVGITTGPLLASLERAVDAQHVDDDTLREFDDAYAGFQTAARIVPPHRLIDAMIGKVAVLDGLRRRASSSRRHALFRMQARYAESLSWLAEEAGHPRDAMWWIDRASQWGLAAGWQEIAAYGSVRRSMIAISATSDGFRAVDHARTVHDMPGATPRIKGLAAKQAAFGYALCGDADASRRALDEAMQLLAKPVRPDDAVLGQRSVVDDDLYTIFATTCDIYLGKGQHVVPIVEPRLSALSRSSLRTATITRAKLVRAYVNAGQPDEAAAVAGPALTAIEHVGSLSALSELRRALPILQRWRGRDDIAAIIDHVRRLAPTAAAS